MDIEQGVQSIVCSQSFREGVKFFEDKGTETQSRISEETNTAQRYIHHKQLGMRVPLFVPEYKEENEGRNATDACTSS